MGMYTELFFEGMTKNDIPREIMTLMEYFFNSESETTKEDVESNLPDHPLFITPRWDHIGYVSSYYHLPMAVKKMYKDSSPINNRYSLLLRCDIKNYDDEIALFLHWINPYMEWFRGWVWYEEWDEPKIFTIKNYN